MVIYCWKLQTPQKLIFNKLKRGASVGGINDLIYWSEKNLPTYFLPLKYNVKAASFILATLKFLEQQLHIATVPFFLLIQSMLESLIFKPSHLEKAIIFWHFLSNVKRK